MVSFSPLCFSTSSTSSVKSTEHKAGRHPRTIERHWIWIHYLHATPGRSLMKLSSMFWVHSPHILQLKMISQWQHSPSTPEDPADQEALQAQLHAPPTTLAVRSSSHKTSFHMHTTRTRARMYAQCTDANAETSFLSGLQSCHLLPKKKTYNSQATEVKRKAIHLNGMPYAPILMRTIFDKSN